MRQFDWKNALPFPRHWLGYLVFKLVLLAVAAAFAFHALRLAGVI